MDIGIISRLHALEIILAVGDNPGGTIRSYITTPSRDGDGIPNRTLNLRITELADAGLLRYEAAEYRGRMATRVYLSDVGATIYRLLYVIRGL